MTKVVLIGNTQTGKSSLVSRYVNNEFFAFHQPTIGADFFSKEEDGCKLEIWDIAGKEQYRSFVSTYLHNADYVLVCLDAKTLKTEGTNKAASWLNEIQGISDCKPKQILWVVTKIDEASDLNERAIQLLREIRTKNSDLPISETVYVTSAKTGEGVNAPFEAIFTHTKTLQQKSGSRMSDQRDDKSQQSASKLHKQQPTRSWIATPRERPGHALLALLIGIALILLCVPPIAPVALPFLGLGFLITTAWLIAVEAAIAGIVGTALSYILFRIGGHFKLGMWFRNGLKLLEIVVRAVISFVTVLLPNALDSIMEVLRTKSWDALGLNWKAPFALLGATIGFLGIVCFIILKAIITIAFKISGNILKFLAHYAGLIFAASIEALNKNQIDKKQWRLYKAVGQWLLVPFLFPFYILKKIGLLLDDMANSNMDDIKTSRQDKDGPDHKETDEEYYSRLKTSFSYALKNACLRHTWLNEKENKSMNELYHNQNKLSQDDSDAISDENQDKDAVKRIKTFWNCGFWAVPISMANTTYDNKWDSSNQHPASFYEPSL